MVEKKLFKTNTTEKSKTYSSMIFKYGNEGFFTGFTGIFQTNRHILLKYKHNGFLSGFYLASKENWEGNYHVCTIPKDPMKIPVINIVGSTEQAFIGTFTATHLIELYNKIDINNREEIFGSFRMVVENLDEESNPCLIFYEFE